MTICLDTDVIIRFLTGDDVRKQEQARAFFEQVVAGKTAVTVTPMAIADAAYVLTSPSLYRISRSDAAEMLVSLVTHPGFVVEHKARVIAALTVFRAYNLDFGDAYTAATALESESAEVLSYDRDFERVPGISRVEP